MDNVYMFNFGIVRIVEKPRYCVVWFKEGGRIYWKTGKRAGQLL